MKIRSWLWLAAFTAVVVAWAGPVAAAPPVLARFEPAGPPDLSSQIVRNWHSGQCLTAFGRSGPYLVQQWTCWGYPYQQWRLAWTDSGWFELVVAATGECLEVGGGSLDDNHKVVTNVCNGTDNQQWTQVPAPVDGGYVFLVARHSGKCLAIPSQSPAVGANPIQYACSADPNGGFYWTFTPL
jgi:hypothetical protein